MSQGAASASEPVVPEVGTTVGRFKLVERIGAGGMGVVFEAEDTKLRRPVALKFLHAEVAQDAKRRRRFLREGKLAAQLTHPCIASVYEAGEEGSLLYIAMELVRGRKLSDVIGSERQIPLGDAVRIAREVARGLAKAHSVGIIHRDLKPDNVMIGEDGIVKILDFGVAKVLEGSQSDFTGVQTHAGSLVGTPAYMSPEQAAGKSIDGRSDLFSLGVVLYELVTGKQPFRGDTWQETIIAINRDDAEPASQLRAGLPPELDRILDRCLGKKPEERYPDCRELLVDLDQMLLTQPTMPEALGLSPLVTADTLPPPPHTEDPSVRDAGPATHARPRSTLFAAAIVAAIVVAGVGLALQDRGETAPVETQAVETTVATHAPVPQPSSVPSAAEIAPQPSAPAPQPSASAEAKTPERRRPRPVLSAAIIVPPPPPPPEPSAKPKPKNPLLGF